jgi:hypothetical protein
MEDSKQNTTGENYLMSSTTMKQLHELKKRNKEIEKQIYTYESKSKIKKIKNKPSPMKTEITLPTLRDGGKSSRNTNKTKFFNFTHITNESTKMKTEETKR